MEIIRTVEESELPVKRTLEGLGINRSTFYKWYRRYQEDVRCPDCPRATWAQRR